MKKPKSLAGLYYILAAGLAAMAGRWGALGALAVLASAGSVVAAAWLGESRAGLLSALPRPPDTLALPDGSGEPVRTPAPPPSHWRKDFLRLLGNPGFYWRLAAISLSFTLISFLAFGASTTGEARGTPVSAASQPYLWAMLTYFVSSIFAGALSVGVLIGGRLPAPPD